MSHRQKKSHTVRRVPPQKTTGRRPPRKMTRTSARRALLEATSPAIIAAINATTKNEPVVIVARPEGDPLAADLVRQYSWRVVGGVAVGIMERDAFLRHVAPAVAATIAEGIAAGPGPTGVWIVCVAFGGATAGPLEGVVRVAA